MENNDLSSGNNFTVDVISIDRSLMYIREKSGPKTNLCGTPAFTGNHSHVSDHSRQLSGICLSKNFLRSSSNASEISIDLSLKISFSLTYFTKSLGYIQENSTRLERRVCVEG